MQDEIYEIENLEYKNDRIVDMSTGQVLTNQEVKRLLQNNVHNTLTDHYEKAMELGFNLRLKLLRDKRGNEYNTLKIKEEYEFVKVFTVSKREIKKSSNLSKTAKAAYFDLESEIYFPTNTIVIDGESPSVEKLCDFLDLKKSKLYEVLKELEEADLIKRKKINGQLVIYINPFIYNRGFVDYDTVLMFEDSGYNPNNRK